jgi:Flp pilus assembly protein TadD
MKFITVVIILLLFTGCKNIRDLRHLTILKKSKETAKIDHQHRPSIIDYQLEADACFKNRDYIRAAKLYIDLANSKSNLKYFLLAADSYRLSGDFKEAESIYEKIISIATDKLVLLSAKEGKSLCLMQNGDFQSAILLFKEIINEDATRWKTINALAVVLALNNHHHEAVEYFTIALGLTDINYSILNNLGLSFALAKNYNQAIISLQKAISYPAIDNETKKRIEFNLAMVYGISGQNKRAEEICLKYLNKHQVYDNMAFYAQLANNKNLAKKYIEQALTAKKDLLEN